MWQNRNLSAAVQFCACGKKSGWRAAVHYGHSRVALHTCYRPDISHEQWPYSKGHDRVDFQQTFHPKDVVLLIGELEPSISIFSNTHNNIQVEMQRDEEPSQRCPPDVLNINQPSVRSHVTTHFGVWAQACHIVVQVLSPMATTPLLLICGMNSNSKQ